MNYYVFLAAMGAAMAMRDDLPDGMVEELSELRQDFKGPLDDDEKQEFADAAQDIFNDYGFSF